MKLKHPLSLLLALALAFAVLALKCDNQPSPPGPDVDKIKVDLSDAVLALPAAFEFPQAIGDCPAVPESSIAARPNPQNPQLTDITWSRPAGVISFSVRITKGNILIGNFQTTEPRITIAGLVTGDQIFIQLQSNCAGDATSIVMDKVVVG